MPIMSFGSEHGTECGGDCYYTQAIHDEEYSGQEMRQIPPLFMHGG